MSVVADGNYKLYCAANEGKNRWLVPYDGALKVTPGTATTWQLTNTSQGVTFSVDGGYIVGDIQDGKVWIAPLNDGGSGVYWNVGISGDYYVIECLETANGDKRYLDGNADKSNVYLHDDTTRSGSQWLLIPA